MLITNIGCSLSQDSLRSSNILEELELGRNHVGVDDSRGNYQQGRGARALAGALRISRSIRRLGLAGNILGEPLLSAAWRALLFRHIALLRRSAHRWPRWLEPRLGNPA